MSLMNSDLAEAIATLETIIRLQSKVIGKLFSLLLQYMTAEELDNCGVVNEINEIAKLKS